MQIPQNLKEVIQASIDAKHLDFNAYFLNTDDYTMDFDSVDHFAHELPLQESASVFDEYQDPTVATYIRFQAALLLTGYNNDRLVHTAYKYHPTRARHLLNILSCKAQNMYKFNFVYDGFDIRDILARAFYDVIRMLDSGMDCAFFQKNIDDHARLLPDDKAVSSLKRYLIKNGEKLDKLSHFIDKLCQDLFEANAELFIEDSDDSEVFLHGRRDIEYIEDDEHYMELESFYKQKMSIYMTRFWNRNGDRFFDVKTRKVFLEELAAYRESFEEHL